MANPRIIHDRFYAALSALGYPGYAHVRHPETSPKPDTTLIDALSSPELDGGITEALPWLVQNCAEQIDFDWLLGQAKLRNLQNRLGFILEVARTQDPKVVAALVSLNAEKRPDEDTLCWESMPLATRKWMRIHRSAAAAHWNILTRLAVEYPFTESHARVA